MSTSTIYSVPVPCPASTSQYLTHWGQDRMATIFQTTFSNENVWILIKISLMFVPKGPIKNMPALVQIMAWCRPGDKPLSEPMMVNLQTHICVNQPQRVNTLRPRQYNCCYPPMHFLKWKLLLFYFNCIEICSYMVQLTICEHWFRKWLGT